MVVCVCVCVGPLAAGVVVAMVLLTALLMVSVSCLYYLGFIPRLKMMLPTVLLVRSLHLHTHSSSANVQPSRLFLSDLVGSVFWCR